MESAKGGHNHVKKPRRSRKSGRPTYTVSTDKHQGPKKGPSARQEQRKASSGERKKRPTTRTSIFVFTDQMQIPAKFAQSMQIPAKQRPPAVNSG
jgi:hypothetical protein